MKHTLRQQLENLLERLLERKNGLKKNILEYSGFGDFVNAGINQIKLNQIEIVVEEIEEMLKQN